MPTLVSRRSERVVQKTDPSAVVGALLPMLMMVSESAGVAVREK
jgi:hypothetical protein